MPESGFQDAATATPPTPSTTKTASAMIGGFHLRRPRLEGSRVRALYGDMIRSASVEAVLEPALDNLRERTRDIYLHVDLDVLDPSEGRANEYAAPGGLSLAELEQALRLVGSRFAITGAAMTAYNPDCDPSGEIAKAALRVGQAIREAAA